MSYRNPVFSHEYYYIYSWQFMLQARSQTLRRWNMYSWRTLSPLSVVPVMVQSFVGDPDSCFFSCHCESLKFFLCSKYLLIGVPSIQENLWTGNCHLYLFVLLTQVSLSLVRELRKRVYYWLAMCINHTWLHKRKLERLPKGHLPLNRSSGPTVCPPCQNLMALSCCVACPFQKQKPVSRGPECGRCVGKSDHQNCRSHIEGWTLIALSICWIIRSPWQ